jgi:hypothetical protein
MRVQLACICAFLACPIGALAQNQASSPSAVPAAPKTKMEAFQGASGVVIVKGYFEVGTVRTNGQVSVEAVTLRNAQSNAESKGIVIEAKQLSPYSRSGNRAFVDYEEIAGLLTGIDYISRSDKGIAALPNFEATYSTKGEVKATVFSSSAGKLRASIEVSRYGSQDVFMTLEQLGQFREIVAQAQKILDDPRLAVVTPPTVPGTSSAPKPSIAAPVSSAAVPVSAKPKPKPKPTPAQLPAPSTPITSATPSPSAVPAR